MILISAESITKRFEDKPILDSVSIGLRQGDRIGLVGRNGTGKTTLLEILAGGLKPDSGQITYAKGATLTYLEQEIIADNNLTLWEYVLSAREDIQEFGGKLREIERELERDPQNTKLLERLGETQRKFEQLGGFEIETEAKIILAGLGFSNDRWSSPLREFSGGERNRAGLSRTLLANSDTILLDEPTNHLDIETTAWLETRLVQSDQAMILVSHDRLLLEKVVNVIWEIQSGKLSVYKMSFGAYVSERESRRARQEKQYDLQKDFISRTEEFIRKNLAGQKTKQAKSRRKLLERIKKISRVETNERPPDLTIRSSGRSFNHIMAVKNLSVGYGSDVVLSGIDIDIHRGDRFGLIGPNGSGKSTLIKTLLGELKPLEGEIRVGGNVEFAYFDQTLENLSDSQSILEFIWSVDPQITEGHVRTYLARFGFYGDETLKRIGDLSGGEKTKVSLAEIMFQPANFLVFDEPTNHLDLESRQALEDALEKFEGAYLIVSHDRYFLDTVTDKTFSIENEVLVSYAGPYSYYLAKREERERGFAETEKKQSQNKENYSDFKELSRQRSRVEKKLKSVASKITDHERELARLEEMIANEIPRSDWEKLTETSLKKAELETDLLLLYQELEDTKAQKEFLEGKDP
ncbi:MAG: ATP-binding cassette domain-containing protein [candidate division Zixibacteria bacterium]|nr:ATP-binding cassette domain-containing protein [candidate division Zixibacteria bacterium]